jgi:hypothetical protein
MLAMLPALLGSLVRHGLTSLGAVLVALGISEQEVQAFTMASQPVIVGLAIHLVGLVWSAARGVKLS